MGCPPTTGVFGRALVLRGYNILSETRQENTHTSEIKLILEISASLHLGKARQVQP